jgi:glycosyltransferase involved in cell wall biosynthesis
MLVLSQSKKILHTVAALEPRKLRIGISIWSFTPNTGGLQAHAQSLCQHLQTRGHDVTVITRSATRVPEGGDYLFFNEPPAPIQVAGIPVSPLRISNKWKPVLWAILKTAARKPTLRLAARLYETSFARPAKTTFAGYDVIHHIGHATALMGLVSARAAKFHGTPFLVQPTAHPLNFGDFDLDFRLYRQADRLLVHTRYEHDYFRAKGITCPIDVVGNGIEDRADGQGERFRAKHGIKGPMVLYLGRKEEDKGYPLVMSAFQKVRAVMPEATLVCIGPTSADAELGPAPGVVDLKFVTETEKHDALAACTCLCVPSIGESFGLVYMEAGRYRKPVIGRKVAVLEELHGRNQSALLLGKPIPNKNQAQLQPAELAEGMQRLLNNPKLCRQIGEACYQASGYFLWPNVVKRFEQAYHAVLAGTHVQRKI